MRFGAIGAIALLVGACGQGAGATAPNGTAASSPAMVSASGTAAAPTPGSGASTCKPPEPRHAGRSVIPCTIDAPSLAGNKLGDPARISAAIVLPPSYATSSKRYTTVYVLAGYSEDTGLIDVSLDTAVASTPNAPEAIVVLVSGMNALGGSFYVNSSVTGNWEDAIAADLVGYVDGHYRTLPAASSRGIAGTSMGGFGALNLAMRHPEVFGAVYAMDPGLFDVTGAEERLGQQRVAEQILQTKNELGKSAVDPAKFLSVAAVGGGIEFEYAYGVAFAPDPSSPILMSFPYRLEGGKSIRDAAVWKIWDAGFGGLPEKVERYRANLKALRGIVIDYGTNDSYTWIPRGSAYFVTLLQQAGIRVTATIHDGGHQARLEDQMGRMLSFMQAKLAAG